MSKQTLEQKFETMTPARLFKWLVWILVVASAVIATVFILYFDNFKGNLSSSNSDWGTFGDFIGGTLNPILSILSLIALLLTIVLQSKELESTRMELERSASAQESTEKILNEQSKTFARQQFESTFFSLLDQHNKALENLTSPLAGRRGSKLDQVSGSVFSPRVINLSDAKAVLETKNYLCGHYFRVLYQLLKFVATNAPGSTIGQTFEEDKIQFQELTSDLIGLVPNCQIYACPPNETFTVDLLYYPPTPNPVLVEFADLVFNGSGVGHFEILNPNYASPNPMQLYQFRINGYGGIVCDGNCYSETFILLN